jgi:hypothetical protein
MYLILLIILIAHFTPSFIHTHLVDNVLILLVLNVFWITNICTRFSDGVYQQYNDGQHKNYL